MSSRSNEVRRLYATRPRSALLRLSVAALLALGGGALLFVGGGFRELLSGRRMANLGRFLKEDAWPHELQGRPFFVDDFWSWGRGIWLREGAEAAADTAWMATLAIVLAGAAGLALALLGARSLASRDPFVAALKRGQGGVRASVSAFVRVLSVLMRALPEYLIAFVLLAVFGSNAWPAVLALAIHNAGILGRLGGEVIDNLEAPQTRPGLTALAGAGVTRMALVLFGVLPLALGRFLLYFFYRFETCVREATVLGMLGIASLGASVQEARARGRYDEMLLFVLLAGFLVLIADLVSSVARRWIRHA